MKKTRIFIDTDLGDDVDDAAAFMLAFASPELELAGVTTVYKDVKKAGGDGPGSSGSLGREPCAGGRRIRQSPDRAAG